MRNLIRLLKTMIYGTTAAIGFGGLLLLALIPSLHAQTFTVLHSFTGGADGYQPYAGLTIDRGGNLYGTTYEWGGGYGTGTVFRVKRAGNGWVMNTLYTFDLTGRPGFHPWGLTFGPDGALYGTTQLGGPTCNGSGCGAVYRLSPQPSLCHSISCAWSIETLYNFQGTDNGLHDGEYPYDVNLAFDAAGNIYGTTSRGGQNFTGTIFQLVRSGASWTENILYSFSGSRGNPASGVVLDSAGNVYGVENNYWGDVYELSPSGSGWTETVLHRFGMNTPWGPAGLIMDSAGNLYGGTGAGGSGQAGAVYEMAPTGNGWTYSELFDLSGTGGGPEGPMAMDAQGNLYGTTYSEGAFGYGSVFKLTRTDSGWLYTDLHDFTGGTDGAYPQSGVTLDTAGNIYGTASFGGIIASICNGPGNISGCGVVYEITQ